MIGVAHHRFDELVDHLARVGLSPGLVRPSGARRDGLLGLRRSTRWP